MSRYDVFTRQSLVIDNTGVGCPVHDMLIKQGVDVVALENDGLRFAAGLFPIQPS